MKRIKAPEIGPSEKDSHLPTIQFSGAMFSFRGMDPANMVPMASYDTYGLSDLVTGGVGHWRMG